MRFGKNFWKNWKKLEKLKKIGKNWEKNFGKKNLEKNLRKNFGKKLNKIEQNFEIILKELEKILYV